MKMSFHVGDRVRVYGRYVGGLEDPFGARVIGVLAEGTLMVEPDDSDGPLYVHPKQCRRLKMQKRKAIWVNFYPNGLAGVYLTKDQALFAAQNREVVESAVLFVERKEK